MQLVERHIIKKNNSLYREIDGVAFLSKNLYNRANYIIRQEFIGTSKAKKRGEVEHATWIRYNQIQRMLQNDKDFDYRNLPAKVSQHVLKLLDKNWSSFFESIKEWGRHPEKYEGRPKLPKYKHKTKGRNVLTYTIQAISKTELKRGIVLLSGTNIAIQTKKTNINQARIIPRNGYYVVEIIYQRDEKNLNLNPARVAGIDIGLKNLATVTSNVRDFKPFIVNGRPLKSMNQYYNKKKSDFQSKLAIQYVDRKVSNRIDQLTMKRTFKINDYLHKSSRMIVEFLIDRNVGTLIIGKNNRWKTDINIGRRNNQNFVNIPHARFIEMLIYKCKLVGINVIMQNESHTSKCSFIDNESVEHHEKYVGRRVKRGLFKSSTGILINADCNGSANIIRKAIPNAFADGTEGALVRPSRVTPKGFHTRKQPPQYHKIL